MRIGPDSGRIAIRLEQRMHPDLKDTFPGQDKPDHRILNIAYCMAKADTEKSYVLVSKDVNLRMKAKSVGLMAEDYTTDHVRDLEKNVRRMSGD